MKMTHLEVTREVQLGVDMVGKINLNDPRYNYHYKGFCSIVNQIIDIAILHNNRYGDYNVIVDDSQILRFFNQKNTFIGDEYDAGVLFLNEFFNGRIQNTFNAHTLPNYSDLKLKNTSLNNILELKSEVVKDFNRKLNELLGDEKYIGVQLRGTDKKNEIEETPDNKIIEGINTALGDSGLTKIFLATDDMKYVDLIRSNYSEDMVVINHDNTFSLDGKPIHTTFERNKINLDVLRDVYLLKNSTYLCYMYSNVSHLAMIMGVDTIKEFKLLNNL